MTLFNYVNVFCYDEKGTERKIVSKAFSGEDKTSYSREFFANIIDLFVVDKAEYVVETFIDSESVAIIEVSKDGKLEFRAEHWIDIICTEELIAKLQQIEATGQLTAQDNNVKHVRNIEIDREKDTNNS